MTENEAKKILDGIEEVGGKLPEDGNDVEIALMMAKDALEEIQQYRAIGTPTQIYEKIGGLDVELGKYHSIGTIEEFKALKECVYVDERPYLFVCPECNGVYTIEKDERHIYCKKCSAKIDWDKVILNKL